MALNFAGLGFSFGAKDEGFNKQADKAAQSLDDIGKSVKRVDDIARTNKLNLLANSFQMLQLNNIDNQIDRLNDSLNNYGSEGTRSLDQVTDATARMKANFVFMGEEGARASQMVTRTIGTAGGTVEEVSSSAKAFMSVFSHDEIGSRFQNFFKLTKLGGVNAEEFAGQIANFEKAWSRTGESREVIEGRTASMIDQIVAVGGAVGQADVALQQLPAVIKQIDESSTMFRDSLSPEMFQQAVVGSTALAAAMHKNGVRMEQGIPAAMRLFSAFADGRVQMDKMKTGLGGNLDALKDWGVAGIDLQSAFDLMKKDPLAAAQSLAKLRQKIVDSGGEVYRFDDAMNAVAPDVMVLLKNLGKDADSILGEILPNAIATSEGAAAQFTKEMSKSGVIQQEVLERSQESFKRTMASIALKSIPGVQASVAKNFYESGRIINKFVDKGGPLGLLTGKLIGVKEQGFMALFGAMGPVMDVFGEMAIGLLPVITALGAVGFRFGWLGTALKSPFTGIAKLSSTLFTFAGPVGPLLAVVGGLGAVGAAFAVAGTEGGQKFIGRMKEYGQKGGEMLLRGLTSIAPEATLAIGKFFGVEQPKMKGLIKIPKSGIISDADRQRLREKFKIEVPAEGPISPALREKILKANETLRGENKKSMDNFVTDTVKSFDFGMVWAAAKKKMIEMFTSVSASDIAGFVTKGVELVQTGATAIIDGFVAAFSGASTQGKVVQAGMALESPLGTAFGQMIANVGKGVWTAMKGMFSHAFDGVTDETKTWGQRLSGLVIPGVIGAFAISKIAGPVGGFVGFLRKKMSAGCEATDQISVCANKSGGFVSRMFQGAKKNLIAFGGAMKNAALHPVTFAKSVGTSMKNAALATWSFAKSAVSSSWTFVKSMGGSMKAAALSAWSFGKTMVITGMRGVMAFGKLAASAMASMVRVAISFAPVIIALAAFGALVGIVFAIGKNAMRAFSDESLDTMGKIEETGEGALKDILGFTFGIFGVAREQTDMFVDWLAFALGDGMNSAFNAIADLGEDIWTWITDRIEDFGFFVDKIIASFKTIGGTAGDLFTNMQDLLTGKVTVGELFTKNAKESFGEIDELQKKRDKDRAARDVATDTERSHRERDSERYRDEFAAEQLVKMNKMEVRLAAEQEAEAAKKAKARKAAGERTSASDIAAAGAESEGLIDSAMAMASKGATKLGEMLGIVEPEAPAGQRGKKGKVAAEGFDFAESMPGEMDTSGFDFATQGPAMETGAQSMPDTVGEGGLGGEASVRFAPEEMNTLRAQTAAAQAQVTGMTELTNVMRSMQQAIEMLVASTTKRTAAPAGAGRTQVDVTFSGDANRMFEKRTKQAMAGSGASGNLGP